MTFTLNPFNEPPFNTFGVHVHVSRRRNNWRQSENLKRNSFIYSLNIIYPFLSLNYNFLAPNFIGPPTVRLALLASSSFCRISFLSSRFFLASSNLALLGPEFSSMGSNSDSSQACWGDLPAWDWVELGGLLWWFGRMGTVSLGLHASEGEVNSASAS